MTADFVPPVVPSTATADDDTVAETTAFLTDLLAHGEEVPFDELAQALAAAGLLVSPLGRAVTQAERDVIDAAIAETETEDQLPAAARALDAPKRSTTLREYDRIVTAYQKAKAARRAAVNRLQTARHTT